MDLNSLNQADIRTIKTISSRFKNKYPRTYHEIEDLEGECYVQYPYIKSIFVESKGKWESYLVGCLWNHLNKICLIGSSPLTIKMHVATKLLADPFSPFFKRNDIENHQGLPAPSGQSFNWTPEEQKFIDNTSYSRRENTIHKRKHPKVVSSIKEKLFEKS
jgi:hypothetical protein